MTDEQFEIIMCALTALLDRHPSKWDDQLHHDLARFKCEAYRQGVPLEKWKQELKVVEEIQLEKRIRELARRFAQAEHRRRMAALRADVAEEDGRVDALDRESQEASRVVRAN